MFQHHRIASEERVMVSRLQRLGSPAHARRQVGQDALKAKPHPGRPKKLTDPQARERDAKALHAW